MNAPMLRSKIVVRAVDLRDANECAWIDAWVMDQEAGLPFHRPAWLKAVEAGTGQEAHCLLVETASGEIVAILPLHLIHSPLFGRALVSSGFAVGGGILSNNPVATRRLANAVWEMATRWSCPTVELRGGALSGGDWIEKRDAHANSRRALSADAEAELLAIPRKQRAEVRKGLESNLTI